MGQSLCKALDDADLKEWRIFKARQREKAIEEVIDWNWLCQKTCEQGTIWQPRDHHHPPWGGAQLKIKIQKILNNLWDQYCVPSHPLSALSDQNFCINSIPRTPVQHTGWVAPLGFAMGVTRISVWSNPISVWSNERAGCYTGCYKVHLCMV